MKQLAILISALLLSVPSYAHNDDHARRMIRGVIHDTAYTVRDCHVYRNSHACMRLHGHSHNHHYGRPMMTPMGRNHGGVVISQHHHHEDDHARLDRVLDTTIKVLVIRELIDHH